jgi:hypothetical protein
MATQLFERDEPDDRPELDFRALEPPDLLRLAEAFLGLLAGEVRLPVEDVEDRLVEERLEAADVRFDAVFFAALFRVVEPLEAVFFAVELLPPELPEADFFAVELLPPELPEADFFAVEPRPPDLPEAVFFAVDPFDVDFFAVEPRWRFTLPSWISPCQPSTSSVCRSAWLATNRRKCFSSSRTRRPCARQRFPVRSKRPCG